MYRSAATFFVDLDSGRNERRYRILLEEQFRIAYVSGGAMTFNDAELLSTEDRTILVEIIKKIKKEEQEQIKKAQGKQNNAPQPPPNPQRFSSKNQNRPSRPPGAPKR